MNFAFRVSLRISCVLLLTLTVACTPTTESDGALPMEHEGPQGLCLEEEQVVDASDFDAWRAASTAVIVGTIDRISVADSPVVLSRVVEGQEGREFSFGDPEDCKEDTLGFPYADIHLRNVETLYGEEQADRVVIRTTLSQLARWEMYADEDWRGNVRWHDNSGSGGIIEGVFEPGARIGGSIRHSSVTDLRNFQFRMFEVVDGVVNLQRFSDGLEASIARQSSCEITPYPVTMLLETEPFDGMAWTEFKGFVQEGTVDVEALRGENEALDRYLRNYFEELEGKEYREHREHYRTCVAQDSFVPEPQGDEE